jgi:hypothetical protein
MGRGTKGLWWQDGRCVRPQHHRFPCPRAPWLWPTLSVQSTSKRDQKRLPEKVPFLVGSTVTWCQVHYIVLHVSHKRKHSSFSTRHLVYIHLAFPACSWFVGTTTCELTECLIYHHDILHRVVSDQGTHFIAHVTWQWTYVIESTGIAMIPTSLTIWLERMVKWLWNGTSQ